MTLQETGEKHQTDKATHHKYLGLYELILSRFRKTPNLRILEIGVQFGNSIRTWLEWFPSASIYGIDAVSNNVTFPNPNVTFIIGNAYSDGIVNGLAQFDIIIDDGSHTIDDQTWFVHNYALLLKKGGLLIVEDVETRDTIQVLAKSLLKEFQYTAVEMVEGESTAASRLFIAWQK